MNLVLISYKGESVMIAKKDVKFLERYVVNGETMAILPFWQARNLYGKIIEIHKELFVKMKPAKIIDLSCRYYGSSLKGRKIGTKELVGVTHKPPIVIDPVNTIYFFPTASPTKPYCTWFSHAHISSFKKVEHDRTCIQFINEQTLTLDISHTSFGNQFYRTAQLRTVVSSRIEEEQRKMNMLLFPNGQKSFIYEQIIRDLKKGN